MLKAGSCVRAMRLPFATVSVMPFIAGTFAVEGNISMPGFLLGLIAVVFTHIGANLVNDLADSRSGADWKDKRYFGFFGGSKLIQEGVLGESFYLKGAVLCFVTAFISVVGITLIMSNILAIWMYLAVLAAAVLYSAKPAALSYRNMGEIAVFTLFGPVPVAGGYYIQSGVILNRGIALLSLPFGLFAVAVLFANEIADHADDTASGKNNWAGLIGPERAYILFGGLVSGACLCVGANILYGNLSLLAALSLLCLIPACRAGTVLKASYTDKSSLVRSSKLVILAQTIACGIMTADVVLAAR